MARYTEQGAYEQALNTRLAATVEDRDLLRTLSEAAEAFELIAPEIERGRGAEKSDLATRVATEPDR